ncbi:MAG TPA: hypothetical protein VNQ76_05685 [Planctomicrobium sp.]|nr:hypothetical protein [Planctomicrobium sp.]
MMITPVKAVTVCILILALWSCSQKDLSSGQCQVAGRIDLDGTPIAEGFITFKDPENVQRSYGGPIRSGKFSVAVEPGRKLVEVTAQRQVPGKMVPGPSGEEIPAMESYIPEKYNRKSELTVEIASSGKNDLQLNLTTQ